MGGKKKQNYSKTTLKMPILKNAYYCPICDYTSSNNSNYKKHLRTNKHLEKAAKTTQTSKPLVSVNCAYNCELCSYSTSRKSNWSRHIVSVKHLKNEQKTSKQDGSKPSVEAITPFKRTEDAKNGENNEKTRKIQKNPRNVEKRK